MGVGKYKGTSQEAVRFCFLQEVLQDRYREVKTLMGFLKCVSQGPDLGLLGQSGMPYL